VKWEQGKRKSGAKGWEMMRLVADASLYNQTLGLHLTEDFAESTRNATRYIAADREGLGVCGNATDK